MKMCHSEQNKDSTYAARRICFFVTLRMTVKRALFVLSLYYSHSMVALGFGDMS